MDTAVADDTKQADTAAINAIKIKLLILVISNFKGIREFTLIPGDNAVVRGDNATGKTTLVDAFTWLLFDKDSQGKKDFEIKSLDKDNNPLHNLEHTVEGVFDVGERKVRLKKVYKEKWAKKRGSTHKDLTGHTTDYFVDEVPTSKRDYEAEIKKIVEEETFRLLTSATYFNNLHWEKRRNILLSVCGDVEDNEVIGSSRDLAGLQEILDGKSLADRKKIVSARKTAINKRLEQIPPRIDELNKSLQGADGDPEYLQRQIDALDKDLAQINVGGVASFDANILRLNNELAALVSERDKERDKKKASIRREIGELNTTIDETKRKAKSASGRIEDIEARIERKKEEMVDLREEWGALDEQDAGVETSCPACQQDLPVEAVQSAINQFNEQKAERLRKIKGRGKALAADVEGLRSDIENIKREQGKSDRTIADISTKVERKQTDLNTVDSAVIGEAVTIARLKAEIEAAEEDKKNHKSPPTAAIEEKLAGHRDKLALIKTTTSIKSRIKDLEEEEKDLAGEYEKLEQATYMMEKFIVAKVDLLEEKINGMFDMAKFKLFNRQVNGGIEETCETIYNGVPFSTALNYGARVAVGLDIVKTLQAHHKTLCTVFVDNHESVTKIPEMNCQVIKLFKDENYKELTVELN